MSFNSFLNGSNGNKMKSPSMAAKKKKNPHRDAAVVVDELRVLSSLFTVQATIIPAEFSSIRDS